MALLCNGVAHWLGANLESALCIFSRIYYTIHSPLFTCLATLFSRLTGLIWSPLSGLATPTLQSGGWLSGAPGAVYRLARDPEKSLDLGNSFFPEKKENAGHRLIRDQRKIPYYLIWERISTTCVMALWRNDINCINMFMFLLKK